VAHVEQQHHGGGFSYQKACKMMTASKLNKNYHFLILSESYMQYFGGLTFWRQNYFFKILAHPIYKM